MKSRITSDQWKKVESLFQRAIEQPPEERAAFLARECADQTWLAEELRSLLESYDEAENSFLEKPNTPRHSDAMLGVPSVDPSGEEPGAAGVHLGRRIGPYRVVREIGLGGMGAVYLAEREDELDKKVAIKFLHPGSATTDLIRRFRNERSILSRIEHQNVASLIDGGTTEDGLPYFIMEYVDGLPIDQYCDEKKLSIRDRLSLFRQVCSAIQVAHQNMVVHRDIKPGNILVTDDGIPKLLDFGIAKFLSPELSPVTMVPTRMELRPMTPEYSSPEQAKGEPVTSATDVYSCGVLLYELMVGQRPYRFDSHNLLEMTKVICESEPRRPSTAVMTGRRHATGQSSRDTHSVSRARATTPEKLRRRLRGDLDNIVMKALRKEPRHRYASVEQFSDDVDRYLLGLPVRARTGTFSYRTAKFISRHRVGVVAATAMTVAITAFSITTVRARVRAEQEAAKASAINDFLQSTLRSASPWSGLGADVTVADALDSATAQISDWFVDQPVIEAAVSVNIAYTYFEMGRYDEAEALFRRSMELQRDTLPESDPEFPNTIVGLGIVLQGKGEYEESEKYFRHALAIERKYGERQTLADAIKSLGSLVHDMAKYEEAEALYREALVLYRRGSTDGARAGEATTINNLGFLLLETGELDEAKELFSASLAVKRKQGIELNTAATMSNLARVHHNQGDVERAEALFTETLETRRRLLGEDHPAVSASKNYLAGLFIELERYDEADALLSSAIQVEKRAGRDDQNLIYKIRSNYARLMQGRNDYRSAEEWFTEVLEKRRSRSDENPVELARSLFDLGALKLEVQDCATAEPLIRDAIERLEQLLPPTHWELAVAKGDRARCLDSLGKAEAAERLLIESYQALEVSLGEDHPKTQHAEQRLASLRSP